MVVEGEVVDLDALSPQPLAHPPAVRSQWPPNTWAWVSCRCGKGSIEAHGGYSCDEIVEFRARIEFGRRPAIARLIARLRGKEPFGWRVQYDDRGPIPLATLRAVRR